MDISPQARRRIEQLRRRRHLPRSTAVRVGFEHGGVRLCWAARPERFEDLALRLRGLRVVMDVDSYMGLSDRILDCADDGGKPRFVLRHI